MNFYQITVYVLGILALIIGLFLSGSGSTGGLSALSSHDLEIFKKTKDYGLIRILKISMFMIILLIIIFLILNQANGMKK